LINKPKIVKLKPPPSKGFMNYEEAMKELYGDKIHPNAYMENDDNDNADKF